MNLGLIHKREVVKSSKQDTHSKLAAIFYWKTLSLSLLEDMLNKA